MSVLTFNRYTHGEDECGVKIDNRIIEDQQKRPLIRVMRWTIIGVLRSNGSPGAMSNAITALEDAYGDGDENYGDATFDANGHTHTMPNSTAFSGVRCSAFGWMTGPWKMHTELSNRRTFYAVLQAEYRFSNQVISYREEVQQIGTGGPRWRFMPSLAGPPQRQTLQLATPVKYAQRGALQYRTSMPAAPASVFHTADMHHDLTKVVEIAPQSITKNGVSQTNEIYTVKWEYFAETATPVTLGTFNIPDIT